MCNAPGDACTGTGESEVGKLLWEFMRTSMDYLQRMADAKQAHTARVTDSRVRRLLSLAIFHSKQTSRLLASQ
jgi:hypothetical protein